MPLPVPKDESRLLEASARYLAMEGTLLLTNKRLVFYCMIKEYFRDTQFEVVFDVPHNAIINAYKKGTALSLFVVETDTRRVTGNPKHEFFLIDAQRWVSAITPYLKKKDTNVIPQRPGPQQAPARRFGKLCLRCMKVVPDDTRLCPHCGEDV